MPSGLYDCYRVGRRACHFLTNFVFNWHSLKILRVLLKFAYDAYLEIPITALLKAKIITICFYSYASNARHFQMIGSNDFLFQFIFFFRWLIKSFNILLSRPKFRKHLTKRTSPHVIAYLLTGLKRIRKATLGLTQNDINEIITLPLSSSHNKFST